jgi:hypothetical protein
MERTVKDPVPQPLLSFHLATMFLVNTTGDLIDLNKSCRPVPWYTYACFWLALLATVIASLWLNWLYWDLLWRWAARLWAKLRGRDDSALK